MTSRPLVFSLVSAIACTAAWVGCSSVDAETATPADSGASDATSGSDAAPSDAGVPDDAASPFVMAPHRPWPVLLPHTARVLHPMTLVSIVAANDDLTASLFAFADAAIASAWWHATGDEYGVGPAAASIHVNGPAITVSPDRAGLIQYIDDAIGDAGAPAPNGNTLYLVYMPGGLSIAGATFKSFHGPFPAADAGAGDGFAVVSRQTAPPGESELDMLTMLASHEIIEAATDPGGSSWRVLIQTPTPWTGSVWSAMQPGTIENGDLCEGNRIREPLAAGFLYQRAWSANQASPDAAAGDPCAPRRSLPYNNVSVPQDWYVATPGQPLKIPFTGWSTAETKDWLVNVGVNNGSAVFTPLALNAGISIATSIGSGTTAPCASRQAVNNGATGTITVNVPTAAASGEFAVLSINSFREAATCNQAPDDDLRHSWMVGFYVP